MDSQKELHLARPERRVKVALPLLRKARMLAASRGTDVRTYLDSVLRPILERDYAAMFLEGPAADGLPPQ